MYTGSLNSYSYITGNASKYVTRKIHRQLLYPFTLLLFHLHCCHNAWSHWTNNRHSEVWRLTNSLGGKIKMCVCLYGQLIITYIERINQGLYNAICNVMGEAGRRKGVINRYEYSGGSRGGGHFDQLFFWYPICIRMFQNKAQIAQESIKTP